MKGLRTRRDRVVDCSDMSGGMVEVTKQHADSEQLANHCCDFESMNGMQLPQQMLIVRNVKAWKNVDRCQTHGTNVCVADLTVSAANPSTGAAETAPEI